MQHGVLKKLALLPFLVVAFLFADAQQDSVRISKSSNKASFHVIANVGALAGKSSCNFQWQVIPGIQLKHWFAGAGGGIDYYYWRTVPLFLDVRKTFSKPHAFFLYGDAGLNLPWIKKEITNPWYTLHFKKGFYYDAGGGWHFSTGKKSALLLSAGYAVKRVIETHTIGMDKVKLAYDLRRIAVKVGFQF